MNLTPVLSCTLQDAEGVFCDAPVAPDTPLSACKPHLIQIFRYCSQIMRDHGPQEIPLDGFPVVDITRLGLSRSDAMETDFVYYLAVGDLIKVGTCRDLRTRLEHYPPNSRLLALERGGLRREADIKRRLADDLAYPTEWFRPTPTVLDHVASIRAANTVAFSRAHELPQEVADDDVLVTTAEAALMAGIGENRVRQLAARGVLPRMGKRGCSTLHRRSDVFKLIQQDPLPRRLSA